MQKWIRRDAENGSVGMQKMDPQTCRKWIRRHAENESVDMQKMDPLACRKWIRRHAENGFLVLTSDFCYLNCKKFFKPVMSPNGDIGEFFRDGFQGFGKFLDNPYFTVLRNKIIINKFEVSSINLNPWEEFCLELIKIS